MHFITGICTPVSYICDGFDDIPGGIDEANCTEWICPNGYTRCADNLQCVLETKFCDGEYDCVDKSDEGDLFCYHSQEICLHNCDLI